MFSRVLELDRCLMFSYHMYGANMGTIAVKLITDSDSSELFITSGDKGQDWKKATIDIPSGPNAQVGVGRT